MTHFLSWYLLLLLSCVQLFADPMDYSTPGFPVLHHLPELTQTHVHWVGDSWWCHPTILFPCCPLRLQPSIFASIRVFSTESVLHIRWPEYWSFSFSKSPSSEFQDWFPLGWTGWISLQSKGLSESSPTPQFKSINSLAFSFLHSPILTSIHDHWKNHSFD